jgi:hypothetical protein
MRQRIALQLILIELSLLFLAISGFESALAFGGQYFVARRYYCRSAQQQDAGDQTISADAASCAASRQAIQSSFQSQGGDPCHSFDQDWTWTGVSEEIQDSGLCPPQ